MIINEACALRSIRSSFVYQSLVRALIAQCMWSMEMIECGVVQWLPCSDMLCQY